MHLRVLRSLSALGTGGLKCARGGRRRSHAECSASDFWYINDCAQLQAHFPCERGCMLELGRDVPNYVMDPDLPNHGTCLVSQEQARCEAVHPGTARLCPCVKVGRRPNIFFLCFSLLIFSILIIFLKACCMLFKFSIECMSLIALQLKRCSETMLSTA